MFIELVQFVGRCLRYYRCKTYQTKKVIRDTFAILKHPNLQGAAEPRPGILKLCVLEKGPSGLKVLANKFKSKKEPFTAVQTRILRTSAVCEFS